MAAQELHPHWQEADALANVLNVAPFAGLLLAIAVFPLLPLTRHWWESNLNKLWLSLAAAAGGVALYWGPTGDARAVWHAFAEYLSFMALLGALFVVSGGIHIKGSFAGFPHVNTLFLAIGAVLANLLGTTGASLILIRPLIRANRHRRHKTHLFVFFIFLVSNCGGLLTPLGDPPLYLGFLRGVPFTWTLGLFKQWLFVVGLLLAIFHLLDTRVYIKEDLETKRNLDDEVASSSRKIHVEGWRNVLFLMGVIVGVILSPSTPNPLLFQILFLGGLGALSYWVTPARIHQENQLQFHPLLEVGALFLGIFGAMLPALAVLQVKAPLLGLDSPGSYFWATGLLSGFLDNAPTYLTFSTLAAAERGISPESLAGLAAQAPSVLAAISCGAVFLGALTYIGNGPNFMVKSICEHSRIKMPSFGSYLLWSGAVLLPVMLAMAGIFF